MLVASLVVAVLAAEPPWQRQDEEDGLLLDAQAVEGSPYQNLRVTGHSTANADVFARAWWGKASDTSANSSISKREVLLDEENERRFYDIVHVPVASDRDYVLHVVKSKNEETGVITIKFTSVADERKPVTPARVRMKVESLVVFTPDPAGGSNVVYTVFTDIGGSLPAFFARGPTRKGTLEFAKELRRRAQTPAPATP